MQAAKLSFLVHAVIETAAGASFIFHPEGKVPACTVEAKLILRQYGGLLLASSLACLAILMNPISDNATRQLSIAFGSYHIWPCYRALTRLQNDCRRQPGTLANLGGPGLHIVVHSICLGLFVYTALSEVDSRTS
ncbi:hypothetical protein GGR57DRAFT_277012 [Xylariaceae sp. FL1272]|nr:hypothetical protein GGR57DRAFT_277012 [Xylariaceae sp. FL1272]